MPAAKRKNGGNQALQSIQTGALFSPILCHTASQRAGDKIGKHGGEGRREAATAPPEKSGHTDPISYLERVTIHFAVLRVHVAEAVIPTQGGPVAATGEAF